MPKYKIPIWFFPFFYFSITTLLQLRLYNEIFTNILPPHRPHAPPLPRPRPLLFHAPNPAPPSVGIYKEIIALPKFTYILPRPRPREPPLPRPRAPPLPPPRILFYQSFILWPSFLRYQHRTLLAICCLSSATRI